MQPLINSEQMCKYLGVSYRRFLQLTMEDSSFPARKVGGEWKVDPDELKDWFKNQPGCGRGNVVQMVPKEKPRKGRPPKALRTTPPPGGWQVRIPDVLGELE